MYKMDLQSIWRLQLVMFNIICGTTTVLMWRTEMPL